MKRIASVLLVLLIAVLPFDALTESDSLETPDGFLYTLDESGDATITGYTDTKPDLVIPGEVDGHAVVAVEFDGMQKAESVVSLTFPGSVKEIRSPLYGFPNLTRVALPSGITSLVDQQFIDCASLTDVVIPESVKSIGDSAFAGCTSLTDVVIPEGVTSIGSYAFSGCKGLTSIAIPTDVIEIGANPFDSCTSLVEITVAPGNEAYEMRDGALFSKADNELISYPAGLAAEEYAVPEGTVLVGYSSFSGCPNLKSVTLPEGIKVIGFFAFYKCENLSYINLPEGLNMIGHGALGFCKNLTEITIPQSLEVAVFNPFIGCSSLTDITVSPDNAVFEVVDGALILMADGMMVSYLAGNPATEYEIPQEVTQVGSRAFAYCDSLVRVTIPDGVTIINTSAFGHCANLESVVIPKSVTDISDGAFEGCDQLVLTVEQGSYAEWFAKRQELPFVYAE